MPIFIIYNRKAPPLSFTIFTFVPICISAMIRVLDSHCTIFTSAMSMAIFNFDAHFCRYKFLAHSIFYTNRFVQVSWFSLFFESVEIIWSSFRKISCFLDFELKTAWKWAKRIWLWLWWQNKHSLNRNQTIEVLWEVNNFRKWKFLVWNRGEKT